MDAVIASPQLPKRRKTGKHNTYTAKERSQIGKYGLEHGGVKTSRYFSQILGFTIAESTVRNFMKVFKHKFPHDSVSKEASQLQPTSNPAFKTESLAHLDKNTNVSPPESTFRRLPVFPGMTEETKPVFPGMTEETKSVFPLGMTEESSQHSIKRDPGVETIRNPTTSVEPLDLSHSISPVLSDPMKTRFADLQMDKQRMDIPPMMPSFYQPVQQQSSSTGNETAEKCSTFPVLKSPLKGAQSSAVETFHLSHTSADQEVIPKRRNRKPSNNTYTGEERYMIGKFGAQYGSSVAARHFSSLLGRTIAESTVRNFIKCFKTQPGVDEAASMPVGRKGRPLHLGTDLDKKLIRCLRAIKASGRSINTVVILDTARSVISHENPKLLVENGGNVSLNKSFARSVLVRMEM